MNDTPPSLPGTTADLVSQYEAFPYPDRDPADETKRLITGSPSIPAEMDHWLWGGARDWSKPLRVLVAGGGTGDGLIQLAQMLSTARRPYRITYVDLSRAARDVAERRAKARGLDGIAFHTGSLLEAGALGPFDYIDCCGVLHHLPDPQAGFDALAGALAPGGGIGLMVYAPLGRSGVYPLQAAFSALFQGLAPVERLEKARAVFRALPKGHPFHANPHLVDHRQSDAGFYDLLLHSSDRPFTISQLVSALDRAGLALAGVPEPALYDPAGLMPDGLAVPDGLDPVDRMALAENLRGTFKTHVVYAVKQGAVVPPPMGRPDAIPQLRGTDPRALAKVVGRSGAVKIDTAAGKVRLTVPKAAAGPVAAVNGLRSLGDLARGAKLDPIAFNAVWAPVERALCGYGLMHYSRLLAR